MTWNFFDAESRDEFRRGLPFDDPTWARARGWAARRFGWRHSPRDVVDLVLADHDRST
jgi:hypothetical protein